MGSLANVSQVGIDSHKNFGAMCMRDADGEKIGTMRLEYRDRDKLAQQLQALPEGTPVIIEGSFGWPWICDFVQDQNLMPHLASALKASQYRKATTAAKSNRIDAAALSELPLNKPFWEVWVSTPPVRDRREILQFRMGLVRQQTQVKNRVHSLMHQHGILHDFSDLFGAGGRAFLAELAREPEEDVPDRAPLRAAGRAVLRGLLNQLQHLRSQIAGATRLFRREMVADPVAKILRTIPGMGTVLAYTVLAEVGNFKRFHNSRALSAYACLVPIADDSGDDTGQAPKGRHISRMGRQTLQWAFIIAAHGAVKKDAWLRDIYNRRTDNGKRDRNRGYIAAARQLSRVCYACVKENRPYQPAPTEHETTKAQLKTMVQEIKNKEAKPPATRSRRGQ